jgi:hypothetical protein
VSVIEAPTATPEESAESAPLPAKIAIKFGGTVILDRSDPRDQAIFRSLELGNDVTLMIEGKCSKKGWGFTTDREGELDVVKLEHAVTIHSVYKPVS